MGLVSCGNKPESPWILLISLYGGTHVPFISNLTEGGHRMFGMAAIVCVVLTLSVLIATIVALIVIMIPDSNSS